MTMHNEGEDTWFPDDAENCVPIWRLIINWIIAAALIGVILAIAVGNALAIPNKNPPKAAEDDDNEVKIALMCGTLKGSGAVVIVDPVLEKVYRFDFTCPTASI